MMNVAIIGCGFIGFKRAKTLTSCRLVTCADTVTKRADELARKIIQQNNNNDQWPSLHLIAGKNDPIVNPVNSNQLAKQWGAILSAEDSVTENIGGIEKTIKHNKHTQKYVELIVIKDLGHGWPVNPEVKFGGKVAPFVLKSPLSAVDHLLQSWQLNK